MQLDTNQIFAGRYKLLSQIGLGGFSEVWKVADEMADDRIMALKIYAPERGLDEHGIKQFRKEYGITLDLNHPHLLKANHFDIANGSPYLVMPFCQGGSLYGKLVEHGAMSEKQVAEMLIQVSAAVEYLHRKHILHQDIKPDNVLIGNDGDYLLTDFGISSKLRSTLQKSTTTPQAMTIAYAPPEKFKGTAVYGPQGDVFSLGVMMYELLTTDLPWNGMGGAYVRPDTELPQLPDTISPALNTLVQQCLVYEAGKRPTPKVLHEASGRYLKTGSWEAQKQAFETQEPVPERKTVVLEPQASPQKPVEKLSTPPPAAQNVVEKPIETPRLFATILAHLFVGLGNFIGVLAFLFAAIWYVVTIPTDIEPFILADIAFYTTNIIGYTAWTFFWLKLLAKRLVLSGLSPKSTLYAVIAQSILSILLPFLTFTLLWFYKGLDQIFFIQIGIATVIILSTIFLFIKPFTASTKDAMKRYVFWWKPLVIAIISAAIAVPVWLVRAGII